MSTDESRPASDHDTRIAVATIHNLHWLNNSDDTVAAARFVAWQAVSGERIGAYDCYLKTDGRVEVWEDLDPDEPNNRGEAARAHPDWHSVLTPMFRAALEASVTR